MRYLALATDYDGTLSSDGSVAEPVVRALERLRRSGRHLILVTGRRLDELLSVCPCTTLFDLVVAENGAIVYAPGRREATRLANPPPSRLVRELSRRGVEPLEVGEVIVATRAPHRRTVQDVLWELGLDAQVIGNRGAVMILPAGVDKASGLEYALRELGLSRHEVVGIGDAENDHAFLRRCECAAAVADAAPALREIADLVTVAENGRGVAELIGELIADDLHRVEGAQSRHAVPLGERPGGEPVVLSPYGHNVLIAGPSSCGKSTVAAGLVEQLIERDYQVCLVDPEGDYGTLRDVVTLGNRWRAPSVDEVLSILADAKINLAVNLLGLPLGERPEFFAQLVPHLQAMRARTGRPHWLVVDEAHHMLPVSWGHVAATLPLELHGTILVTVHPDHVAAAALAPIDVVVAVGHSPDRTLERFALAAARALAWPVDPVVPPGCVLVWLCGAAGPPIVVRPRRGRAERIRHRRKYAEGDLRWHSFWFRGPEGRQNLRVQNLVVFCQIAEGIDDATWSYHLRRGDYSRWFRHAIHDERLADATALVERRGDLTDAETREMIRGLVNARYTLPA